MKDSFIRKSLAVISMIDVVTAFAGCSQNNTETGESSTSSHLSESGVSDNLLVGQWRSANRPNYVYTFRSDSTGQYDMAGKILKLTYSTDNGKITFRYLEEGYSPVTLDYVLEGDSLNIKDSFGSDTFYQKVRNES